MLSYIESTVEIFRQPFDGSGNFVRVHNWSDDAAAGIKILSSRHDEEDSGFATGLSLAICRDGQSPVLADIPFSGKKITNLGNPVNPQDSATKNYCDTLSGWSTSKNISGADLNGRLNFTALGGVNGITWSNADMSWFGKAATANQTSNRLVVNNGIDGTTASPGTDLVSIDEGGRINLSSGVLSNNLSYDGTAWRTPVAGNGAYLQVGTTGINLYVTDAATTTAYQTATLRQHTLLADSAGSTIWRMTKKDGTHNLTNALQAYTGTSLRWQMQLGNTANETGSNAGSDFEIDRYSDGGTYLGTPLTISRATGQVGITNVLSVGGAASFAGGLTVSAGGLGVSGSLSVNSGDLNVAAGSSYLGTGFWGRAGTSGGYSSYRHNFFWQSSTANTLYAYVESTQWGIAMTPCDYRLKDNVRPLASTWEKIKALKPISFTFRERELVPADGKLHWGFLAHEVQESLLPTAATTDKDSEMMQALDLIPVVAALTTALQEAMLRIEALEAKLA